MDLIPARGETDGVSWELSCGIGLLVDVFDGDDDRYEALCERDRGKYAFHVASLNHQQNTPKERLERWGFKAVNDGLEESWVKNPNPDSGRLIAVFIRALKE